MKNKAKIRRFASPNLEKDKAALQNHYVTRLAAENGDEDSIDTAPLVQLAEALKGKRRPS